MNRSALTPRRRLALLGAAVATPLLVAGCGFGVQTNQVYQPAVGANVRSGTVDVLGAVIVSPSAGQGVFLATLVNSDDSASDTLTGITASDGTKVGTFDPRALAPQVDVDLADGGGIGVTGTQVNTTRSNYVKLKLTFADSDPVYVNVPVVKDDGPYTAYGVPSATPLAPNSVAVAGSKGAASTSPSATPSSGG